EKTENKSAATQNKYRRVLTLFTEAVSQDVSYAKWTEDMTQQWIEASLPGQAVEGMSATFKKDIVSVMKQCVRYLDEQNGTTNAKCVEDAITTTLNA
ncbi:MAG: hypothetical protein ACRCWQ_00495, partial [Bacilli bacterium]